MRVLKGIVSRDFVCLQIILMDRIRVPDVLLDVYLFLNISFHIVFYVQSFERVKLLLLHLAKAYWHAGDVSPPWGWLLTGIRFKTTAAINASLAITADFSSCGRTTSPGYCTCRVPFSWRAVKAWDGSYLPDNLNKLINLYSSITHKKNR